MRGAERPLDPLGTVGPSEEEAEVSVALRHVPPRSDGEFEPRDPRNGAGPVLALSPTLRSQERETNMSAHTTIARNRQLIAWRSEA
jgi:hypothetical protein